MQVLKEDYRCSSHNYVQAYLHVWHTELNLNRYLGAITNAKERRGICKLNLWLKDITDTILTNRYCFQKRIRPFDIEVGD